MTTVRTSQSLQSLFEDFWTSAESRFAKGKASISPVFQLRGHWDFWLLIKFSTEQDRTELNKTIAEVRDPKEQTGFIEWLKKRIDADSFHKGKSVLVLLQLAEIEPFRSWEILAQFRQAYIGNVNAVFLQRPSGGEADDVMPLSVVLVPRKKGDPLFNLVNLDLHAEVLEHVHLALDSMLRGFGLIRLILLAALFSWKSRKSWIRHSLAAGWFAVFGLLMALVTGLSPEQEALTAMLWLLYTIMAVLVLVSIPGYLREVVWGFQVAALLQQRQVCLLVRSGFPEAELKPRGRSFSVSLAFGILLALYDEKCVLGNPSWLWGRCLETIAAKSSSYAFTGDLSSTGQIGRVARSADKVEATRKHPMITDFFMPNQDRDLGTEIHQLSGSPQVLRLRRHGNLAKLLLDAGGSFRLAGIIQNLVATLSAVALLTAWPDVHKMLLPPPPPQLVFWKCDWVDYQNSQHSYLVLPFATSQPERFRARLVPALPNGPDSVAMGSDSEFPGEATVSLPVPFGGRSEIERGDVRLQVIRPQAFLWRKLPDAVVLQSPVWGILQKSGQKSAFP